MGVGGLHSSEKAQTVIPEKNQKIISSDVSSYYPSLILNLGLYPDNLGSHFLSVYQDLISSRLQAKVAGDDAKAEALKIVINGTFGKFGNKYSIVYSPELLIAVTLTGQFLLLKLIEDLENSGILVISANTDSVTALVDNNLEDLHFEILSSWQKEMNLKLESEEFLAIYSRDVNNYLAITKNGTKSKGIFVTKSINKNPTSEICIDAIIGLVTENIPIIDTISNCKDIKKFINVRKMKTMGVWQNQKIGTVGRWYYSNSGSKITYISSGNKVAKSDFAKVVLELPTVLPNDIYYKKYQEEAFKILSDIGYFKP